MPVAGGTFVRMHLTSEQQIAWRGLVASLVITAVLSLDLACVSNWKAIPPPSPIVRIGYTGSMVPTFKGGELRFVTKTPFNKLRPGRIVLTYFGFAWHPHRLKWKQGDRWITQGDANAWPDIHPMTEDNYGGTIDP